MVTFFGKVWRYSRRQVCFASWICLKFLFSASRWLHRLLGNSGWYVLHWWCHVVSLRFVGWPVGMVWLALGLGTWCEMNGLRLHLFVDMNGFPLHSMLFASVWMPLCWVAVSQFVRLVLFFWNYWVVMSWWEGCEIRFWQWGISVLLSHFFCSCACLLAEFAGVILVCISKIAAMRKCTSGIYWLCAVSHLLRVWVGFRGCLWILQMQGLSRCWLEERTKILPLALAIRSMVFKTPIQLMH